MKRFSNQVGEFEALLEGSIPECLVWGLVKYGRFFWIDIAVDIRWKELQLTKFYWQLFVNMGPLTKFCAFTLKPSTANTTEDVKIDVKLSLKETNKASRLQLLWIGL